MKIIKMLEVSTKHFKMSDLENLTLIYRGVAEVPAEKDEWIFSVPQDISPETIPMAEWHLMPLLSFAAEYGCERILVTSRAAPFPMLPIYQPKTTPAS